MSDMKCGPENCPLTAWAALSPSERKHQRQSLARKLYEQGFTMETIAMQFGVHHSQIVRDLREFVRDAQIKTTAKTASNPKGAGRPKGKGKSDLSRAAQDRRNERMVDLHDQGVSAKEIGDQFGVGDRMVNRVLELEHARREAVPVIDPATLSMTAQQKFAVALRQATRKAEIEIEQRLRAEIRAQWDKEYLPGYRERDEYHCAIINAHKGVMSKATFRKILACLHPDRGASDKLLSECFDEFRQHERVLVKEERAPLASDLPRDLAEFMAGRKTKSKSKQAKSNNAHGGVHLTSS